MSLIQPKKHLGQHFLKDNNIAKKIVESINLNNNKNVLEIGPGTGVLTSFLETIPGINLKLVEIDRESVEHLTTHFPALANNIIYKDILSLDLTGLFNENFNVIGNFPYNISSPIFFKILEARDKINQVICMVQREVAQRICANPGNKTYGILSVLLQAFFKTDYLFTVSENVFYPPPKVKSAEMRLERIKNKELGCDYELFFRIVKASFNQRRKIIRNSLKSILLNLKIEDDIVLKRPEELSVTQFVYLTNLISESNSVN